MGRHLGLTASVERKILVLIEGEKSQKQILGALKTVKAYNLSRWLKTLEFEKGYITSSRSSTKLYVLTPKGSQRLKELRSCNILEGVDELQLPKEGVTFDFHGYFYKYPIIKKGEIFDPNPTQMTNWVRERLKLPNATVQTNGGQSVTVSPSIHLQGPNPALLWMRAQAICDNTARLLESQYGFVLGLGDCIEHHLEMSDENTKELYREIGYVPGELDGSKMEGEIVFTGKDPEKSIREADSLKQTLKDIPKSHNALQGDVVYLREQTNLLTNTVLGLTNEVGELRQGITEAVKALGKNIEAQRILIDALKASEKKPQPPPADQGGTDYHG